MVLDSALVLNGHEERGHVDQLVVDTDVSVLDLGSGVVHGLGQLGVEDSGLKSSLQELLQGQRQAEIQLVLSLGVQKAVFVHSLQESSAFELSLLVVLLEGQKSSGCLSDLGQGQLDSPDLSLVLETVLPALLDLADDSLLLVGSSGRLVGSSV